MSGARGGAKRIDGKSAAAKTEVPSWACCNRAAWRAAKGHEKTKRDAQERRAGKHRRTKPNQATDLRTAASPRTATPKIARLAGSGTCGGGGIFAGVATVALREKEPRLVLVIAEPAVSVKARVILIVCERGYRFVPVAGSPATKLPTS